MMQNTKGEWKNVVHKLFSRKSLINYDLGVDIVKKLDYHKLYGPQTTILDVYSGASVFSAALHNELKPKTHILMEPYPTYRKFLHELEDPPRLYVEGADPFRWSTFNTLIEDGKLQPVTQPRTQVNNSLLFTANLLHSQGEQLVTQYLNCISNQSWIERYGRVRLLLWMRASVAEKLLAGAGEMFRHRIGCQRESCCDARVVLHSESSSKVKKKGVYPQLLTSPLISHWDPSKDIAGRSVPEVSLVELTPKMDQVEHLDEFEYVIKMIFILKSTPLREALNSLGPGAIEDLSPHLTDLLHLAPTELTADQLIRITNVFWRWPFKPELLMQFYGEEHMGTGNGSEEGGRL